MFTYLTGVIFLEYLVMYLWLINWFFCPDLFFYHGSKYKSRVNAL